MSEKEVIMQSVKPITKESLVQDLKALGLKEGDLVLAHASMSKLGWIVGREVTILDALLEVLGESGTLIMPSQTGENSDPSYWQNPPVPSSWFEMIKEAMPAYDPKRSPTRSMGKVVDQVLLHPLCVRSNHPQVSFCGIGKEAKALLEDHALTPGLGEGSPLQKLVEKEAKVLLLGVGYGNCTCLHLAETKWSKVETYVTGAKMMMDHKPQWIEFEEIKYNDEDFKNLGLDYEKTHTVSKYLIGNSVCRYIDMKDLCDYALTWFENHR